MRPEKSNVRQILFLPLAFFIVAGLLFFFCHPFSSSVATASMSENWDDTFDELFSMRNEWLLYQKDDSLKNIFLTEERNGRWAYEFEAQRAKYLKNWAEKQGVDFTDIKSRFVIKSVKEVGRGYSFYMTVSTEYTYVYKNEPDIKNSFRLGGNHSVDLIPAQDRSGWIISREWYEDPLFDTLDPRSIPQSITDYLTGHPPIDTADISVNRAAAVAYADMYCGAASDGQNQYAYNSEYTNYNALGGDCANFASQALYAGGFSKNGTWNYEDGKGSRAWVNAQALKNYLVFSGRASVLASGSYKEIYRYSYSLRPGDIVAYVKKGKVSHVSVVTGADSKGYPLVSCHNLDRSRVPWDIGWSGDNVKFILLNVSY